ncbi:hypothetical protein ABT346_20300, partial [Micromonospora peucetia]|uniref:hypothetical protein n=1 Tax=Micromonospora peucetia TaxID=47871 RepID=UPI00335903E7
MRPSTAVARTDQVSAGARNFPTVARAADPSTVSARTDVLPPVGVQRTSAAPSVALPVARTTRLYVSEPHRTWAVAETVNGAAICGAEVGRGAAGGLVGAAVGAGAAPPGTPSGASVRAAPAPSAGATA